MGGQPLCNSRTNLADEDSAIFSGVVKDVYPGETEEEYLRALSVGPPSTVRPDIQSAMARLWRGVLTPEDEKNLLESTASDMRPFKGMFWNMPRRVRFELSERFAGPEGNSFELFTGFGGGDCGIGFKKGDAWLIFAHRDSTSGRWSTSVCSGTQHLDDAGQDLMTLRAWKKGDQVKPSIYGHVRDWTNRGKGSGVGSKPLANFKVELQSGTKTRYTVTDEKGNFVFENLSREV